MRPEPAHDPPRGPAVVIEMGRWLPTVLHGLRMLLETVVVPTMLLYVCMRTVGAVPGLIAVLVWCALSLSYHWVRERRLPGTLLLAGSMLVGRTSLSLALSSVWIFVLQPVLGSVLMAVLFLGSALLGRPVTMRLAQDFVSLPAEFLRDHRARRMFVHIALLWGLSRVIDAGMSLGFLQWGLEAGVFSRGVFSVLLTIVSILACATLGWRQVHRMHGVEIRHGKQAPGPAPVL